MSHMNLEFSIISYEDPSVTDPKIRTLDISRTLQGVMITNERTDKVERLQPGVTETVVVTARATGGDGTTQLHISQPVGVEQIFRLQSTGGTPVSFRTKRTIGTDATSSVTLTRVNASTVRIQALAGTPINSASVLVGDFVKFERTTDAFASLFSVVNQGVMFRVISKGSGFIDILDNGAASLDQAIVLGASFDQQLRVMSAAPVQLGDTVEVNSINPNNAGKFQVTSVSPEYVEFASPLGVDETFLGAQNAPVYDRLIGFLFMRANGKVSLKVNQQSQPTRLVRLNPHEMIFIGTVEAWQLDVMNEGTDPVNVTVFHATVPC